MSLLFEGAAAVDWVQDVVEACLDGIIMMPHETITFAFEGCPRRGDLALTSCIRPSAVVAASCRRRPLHAARSERDGMTDRREDHLGPLHWHLRPERRVGVTAFRPGGREVLPQKVHGVHRIVLCLDEVYAY